MNLRKKGVQDIQYACMLLVLCSQHLAQSTEIHKKTFEHYYDGTVGHTVQCSTYLYGTVCKRSENNQMV